MFVARRLIGGFKSQRQVLVRNRLGRESVYGSSTGEDGLKFRHPHTSDPVNFCGEGEIKGGQASGIMRRDVNDRSAP